MKINVAYPTNATQMSFTIKAKEEQRLYGKKIGEQFNGSLLSPMFANTVVQVVGGNDYQGAPMSPKQATTKRIRLLLSEGDIGYRCKRHGVRRRMTVRGSVVSNEILALNVILVQPNGVTIEGLTDVVKDKTHLPKQEKKLRAMFEIPANEDVVTFIHKKIRANDPNAELPNIKVKVAMTQEKRDKISQLRSARESKKKSLQEARVKYEKQYGVKL